MKTLVIIGVVVVLLFLVKLASLRRKKPVIYPYYEKLPLTPVEQVLYFRLITALPDYVVLAQVQLCRFMGVKEGHNFWEFHNKINRLSADYVICRKDFSIVTVIELDDSSHNSKQRQRTDRKKDKSLNGAGIHIIRWHVKKMPDTAEIIRAVNDARPHLIKGRIEPPFGSF